MMNTCQPFVNLYSLLKKAATNVTASDSNPSRVIDRGQQGVPITLEKSLRQRNQELAMLNRAGQALSSTLDLDQVLATVLEEVCRLLGALAASVWLIEPARTSSTEPLAESLSQAQRELVCWQATGPQSDIVRGQRLVGDTGIVGWVAKTSESLIVPDVRADTRHFQGIDRQTGLALRSIISVPLMVHQQLIGVLQVADSEAGRFSAQDLALLKPLAASAAIAIDNARLVAALRHQKAELQSRNEDLDAFAHTVAHDLKGLLAQTIGYAQVLEEDRSDLSEQELLTCLSAIIRSGHKMNNIVDSLLLLARVRQTTVEIGPLDMASIVIQAQQRLSPMIDQYQAQLVLPPAESWPVAYGYGPWIEEVWVNYLSNAIKYGGRPPRIELGGQLLPTPSATGMEGERVRFWVRDNGIGIPLQDQHQLFTPFTRLEQSTALTSLELDAISHGLGLSIVRRIVERLEGQVGLESNGIPGQGSTFFFTLKKANKTQVPPQHLNSLTA